MDCTEKDILSRIARSEERIAAHEKAIEVARHSMEKRLDGMNEFRETLKDQASKFITRAEIEPLKNLVGKFPTRNELWTAVTTAIFITIAVTSLIIKLVR